MRAAAPVAAPKTLLIPYLAHFELENGQMEGLWDRLFSPFRTNALLLKVLEDDLEHASAQGRA